MTDGRNSSSESGYSSISGCRVDYFSFFHLRYSPQSCLCEMCVFCTRVCCIPCLCSYKLETHDCQKVTSWARSKGGICGTANYTVVVFKGLKIDGSWTEPYFDINFYPVISSFLHFLPARFPPRNREVLSPSVWSCPWSCDLPSHAPPLWWHPQELLSLLVLQHSRRAPGMFALAGSSQGRSTPCKTAVQTLLLAQGVGTALWSLKSFALTEEKKYYWIHCGEHRVGDLSV